MHHLKIYKRLFYNADCYHQGTRQTQRGVQIHSTGANNPWLRRYVGPDDGRLGVNQYGNHSNKPGSTVCASAYIGKQADGTVAVYQTLPWDMRCWLSGSGKNVVCYGNIPLNSTTKGVRIVNHDGASATASTMQEYAVGPDGSIDTSGTFTYNGNGIVYND